MLYTASTAMQPKIPTRSSYKTTLNIVKYVVRLGLQLHLEVNGSFVHDPTAVLQITKLDR